MIKTLSKICDAADWFDPDFQRVVNNELKEPGKFHRKQWEFAIIYLALEKFGMLGNGKTGLSMGGGCERVLYAVANKVSKLIVTDLYSSENEWDTARTADPKEFIKSNQPFYVDENKYDAIRMDMRDLKFKDESFDFCYSSCAIEHIGDYQDFVTHLNEVFRVLKDGGIYVFTTELLFAEETIKDEHNYYFSPDYLSNIILNSSFIPLEDPLIELSEHKVNSPLPSRLENFSLNGFHNELLFDKSIPHIILLRGKHPFTSVSLILKKQKLIQTKPSFVFKGLEKTSSYLQDEVKIFADKLSSTIININPFIGMSGSVSNFFHGHEEFFSLSAQHNVVDNTIFHSDYVWMGNGMKNLKIKMSVNEKLSYEEIKAEFRIHRIAANNSKQIECICEELFIITEENDIVFETTINFNDEYIYAFLSKCISGKPVFKEITITLIPVPDVPLINNKVKTIISERVN